MRCSSVRLASIALGLALVAVIGAGLHPVRSQPAGTTLAEVRTLQQALPLLDADDPDLQRGLRELFRSRPGWTEEAAALLRERLADGPPASEARERDLLGLLQFFAGQERVERLIADMLSGPRTPRATRLWLLQALPRLQLDWLPRKWVEAVGGLFDAADPAVRREALATARVCDVGPFERQLRALSRQADLPLEMRVAALDCLAPHVRALPAEAFDLLAGNLSTKSPPLVRLMAARGLGVCRLDAGQLEHLARQLPEMDGTAGVFVLPAFVRSREPALGVELVRGLKKSPALDLLTPGDIDRLLPPYPEPARSEVQALRSQLVARARKNGTPVTLTEAALPPGDPNRGHDVFFSAKATCATCHRAAGKGGSVGPNLSRIGFLRDQGHLFESVSQPNAYVAPEFRTYVFTTRDGRVLSGMIVQETADALYLRTAPATRIRVARADVEEVSQSKTSLMPQGLDQQLTKQELSDLLEFLVRLR